MNDAPQEPTEGADTPSEPQRTGEQDRSADEVHTPVQPTADPSVPYNAETSTPNAEPTGYAATAPIADDPATQPGPQSGPAPAAKKASTIPVVAALAVGALVGGVAGAGVSVWAMSADDGPTSSSTVNPANITVNDPEDATLITAVAAEASPSVVTISATAGNGSGTGSGVVIDDEGHILTNTHVVTLDGAAADASVQVQTYDGRLLEATIVGTDPISDLAVIQVDDASGLAPIDFADSSELNVGDTAIAIGAPLGLAGTVTNGIISALNRSITVASAAVPEESEQDQQAPNEDGQGPFDFWNFDIPGQEPQSSAGGQISLSVIQTDAAINPGNSGGALLNSDGEVIGINVAIASAGGSGGQAGSIGVGFAIPANLAQRVANEIIEDGTASHGLLGAMVGPVTEGGSVGALISDVTPGGPAEAAGLRAGDIVTSFNGLPITNQSDLTAQVRSLAAGEEAEIGYLRDGDARTTEVTLGELP